MLLLQLGYVLTTTTLMPSGNLMPIDDSDSRIQPDIYRHLTLAHRSAKMGRWQQALAHADVVLCLDDLGYTLNFAELPPKDQDRCRTAISEAGKMWTQALDGMVRFREVSENPLVKVNFQSGVISNGVEVGGHAKWLRSVKELPGSQYSTCLQAEIWVRTFQPNGKRMSCAQLKHVAAHELGHVLGLTDSQIEGDIMGPLYLDSPANKISADEVRSIKRLRDQALELRRASLISALYELEGYNLKSASR